jgi:hypothetical protein
MYCHSVDRYFDAVLDLQGASITERNQRGGLRETLAARELRVAGRELMHMHGRVFGKRPHTPPEPPA